MTFAEAITYLRTYVLSETDTNFFTDPAVQQWFVDSARQLAAEMSFPQVRVTQAVTTATTSFSLGATHRFVLVGDVSFEGHTLLPASLPEVTMRQHLTGIPSVYNYDPKKDALFHIGPKPYVSGNLIFEAVETIHTGAYSGAADIWDAKFPEYHELVVLHVARKAYIKLDMPVPDAITRQYAERRTALVAELANTSPSNLMLPAAGAENAGRRMEGFVNDVSAAS